MVWTNPRTWLAGEQIPASEMNESVRDNLDFLKVRIQAGTVNITPVADTPTSIGVTFPVTFGAEPNVVVSPASTAVGTAIKGVSATSPSTTGFTAWVYRTNTTVTAVRWVATVLEG